MAGSSSSSAPVTAVSFQSHHDSFSSLLGPAAVTLLAEDRHGLAMYHEACVYHEPTHSVFITSNQIPLPASRPNRATSNLTVKITRIYDNADPSLIRTEDATPPDLIMGNGGVNYQSGILYCAQGNKLRTGCEGLVHVPDLTHPHTCHSLIDSFHSRPFNSVNDVIVHPTDGSIWFTDPCYGYHQGIRPQPVLPCQVYRFEPESKCIRVMADRFARCNGLCFSPSLSTLYVTDTGAIYGSATVPIDLTGPSHIYAFDIVPSTHDPDQPFLVNRRTFAYADGGWPDGIKCDTDGNVYSGCGDGVEVWNPSGVLLGRILVKGGVANFCFGKEGAMYICNETRVFKVQLGKRVRGALLGI